ncbi:zinc finger protein 346-like [Pistacia vera]|uniref:zinc finger protein 346-like n=1 Tax=Pistacia vera TaxID=55513 RepID=UPI0012635AE7|nr:zinc finger protein 346-like [Pistacia vera]
MGVHFMLMNFLSLDSTGSLASTTLNKSGNSGWTNQSLVSDVTKSIPNPSKSIQPLRCEVCKIDCNSKDVYEKHVSGKKHQRNMQNQLNPTAATLKNSYSTNGQMTFGASGVAAAQGLEKKKQKLLNGGAAIDSVMVCTVCNIACNGEEMFKKHLYGKKHAAQAGLMSLNGVGQYFAEIKAQNNSFWNKVPKKTKVVQSAWCQVCKINCNSNDVYVKHLQGKKHQKNLENLEKSKNGTSAPTSIAPTAATNPIIGPVEKLEADKSKSVDTQNLPKRSAESQSTKDDLETKKQKVVEGGAAANAVRVCTICNVVCNSQTVYSYHLAGQKHAAMLKK